MSLHWVDGPDVEPLTVQEVIEYHRAPVGDGPILGSLIRAARSRVEAITGRVLIATIFDLKLEELRCRELLIDKAPLLTVGSIKYLDSAGDLQTWASSNYEVDAPTGPQAARGRIRPVSTASWPFVSSDRIGAYVVRYTAGYGSDPSDVPADLVQAMQLLIGDWYENREDSTPVPLSGIPNGVLAILAPFKLWR
jgi:uncharacterized phiE125 gp8 family phage protein